MGVCIQLTLSKSITQKEWESVYEETLQLVNAFPLVCIQKSVEFRGINVMCLVKTVEKERIYGRNNEIHSMEWTAAGDSVTLRVAENYTLERNLIKEEIPDAGDAILGLLPFYLPEPDRYGMDNPICDNVYRKWGEKTQGEPYHIYMVAIGCLIEERLGEKAFLYGDITRAQCVEAVKLANQCLKEPIGIPLQCDMEGFYKRVDRLPLTEQEKMFVFEQLYLGTKNAEFGKFLRRSFSEDACNSYWRIRFDRNFLRYMQEYLLWGFDLERLCGFADELVHKGKLDYEKFVIRIMDAKLHLKEKNCEGVLKINQDEARPYSVATLFAQVIFGGASNKKVDRYIPVEKIRNSLRRGLQGKCEVDKLIDAYLAKEAEEGEVHVSLEDSPEDKKAAARKDTAETFRQLIEQKREEMNKEAYEYDIYKYQDLLQFEPGNTITPKIEGFLKQLAAFCAGLLEEEEYKSLMEKEPIVRCKWLAEENDAVLIRDSDWGKIFEDVEKNENSFVRYYPLMRLNLNNDAAYYAAIALLVNDDLYAYLGNLK